MANKIAKFINEVFGNVRGIYLDRQAWLYAKDVCKILRLENVGRAMERIEDDEKLVLEKVSKGVTQVLPSGSTKKVYLVNESGFYSLVFMSRTPEAKEFKRWITHEVLPTLRRTGEYRIIWEESREGGKVTRRDLTDAIKKLYEYATARDEYHHPAEFLYSNYSRLVNKVVGAEDKRDKLTAKQLFQIEECEAICMKAIEKGMEAGRSQHDIWEECKERLGAWSNLLK